ncbi:helix-turn-helix domain-containing protein [bacterium]|nr:helix-turn-helix domain-containing protein [bacterium]
MKEVKTFREFTVIPDEVLRVNNGRLSPVTKLVFSVILVATGIKKSCRPSMNDIAVRIACSRQAVINSIQRLSELKYIRIEPVKGTKAKVANTLIPLWHESFQDSQNRVGGMYVPYEAFKDPKPTIIPTKILENPELKPTDKLLWAKLRKHCGFKGYCFQATATLADELGCNRDTIIEGLRTLEEKGFIARTGRYKDRKQTSNRYTMLPHPSLVEEEEIAVEEVVFQIKIKGKEPVDIEVHLGKRFPLKRYYELYGSTYNHINETWNKPQTKERKGKARKT